MFGSIAYPVVFIGRFPGRESVGEVIVTRPPEFGPDRVRLDGLGEADERCRSWSRVDDRLPGLRPGQLHSRPGDRCRRRLHHLSDAGADATTARGT